MKLSLRRLVLGSIAIPMAVACTTLVACSGDDEATSEVNSDAIAWVSPTTDALVTVGEGVQLTVRVTDPAAKRVRFVVDGKDLQTCDVTAGPNECKRDDLFRVSTKFEAAGAHTLEAFVPVVEGEKKATLVIHVKAATSSDGPDGPGDGGATDGATKDGATGDGGTTTPPPPANRGFLDPDRPAHNVFGGVSWSVAGQRVTVVTPPAGSVTAVANCMKTYGASIRKWADMVKVSRASVVATAITESNCTNPAGSSDGLSSGPMQVTGSTCASVVTGYTSAACKTKMYTDPDFSFQVGVKYMGSSYQKNQHGNDPPKIAAAYNAGSIRQSTANRWHMIVTGNHIERFVGAYNAYRDWEAMNGVQKLAMDDEVSTFAAPRFAGENVARFEDLPVSAVEGQVVFVGDWNKRDGAFVTFRRGRWETN